MTEGTGKNKTVLIGVDGASWNVINPLIEAGSLPNLKKLIIRGSSGILNSIDPLLSPIIWSTIASGKLPDKHGIKDFFVTGHDIKCKRIWDILEESGQSVGIFDYMVTWPPKAVRGFMIPGPFSQGPETFPDYLSFVRELAMEQKNNSSKGFFQYIHPGIKGIQCGITLSSLYVAVKYIVEQKIKKYEELDKFHFQRIVKDKIYSDLFMALYKKYSPSFAVYATNLTDAVQHNFWKYYDGNQHENIPLKELRKYKDIIPRAYMQVDRNIGRIMSMAGEDATFIIVSDHGFQAAVEDDLKYVKKKYINYSIMIRELVKELCLPEGMKYFNLGRTSFIRADRMEKNRIHNIMDEVKRAEVMVPGEMPCRLFDVTLDNHLNINIKINNELEKLENLEQMEVFFNNKKLMLKDIINISNRFSGDHSGEGIIIISGKNIRKSFEISEASVLDVTPTILALLNLPIGKDMDGKVIVEAIESRFLKEYPVTYIESWEEENSSLEGITERDHQSDEDIRSKLAELGYL